MCVGACVRACVVSAARSSIVLLHGPVSAPSPLPHLPAPPRRLILPGGKAMMWEAAGEDEGRAGRGGEAGGGAPHIICLRAAQTARLPPPLSPLC